MFNFNISIMKVTLVSNNWWNFVLIKPFYLSMFCLFCYFCKKIKYHKIVKVFDINTMTVNHLTECYYIADLFNLLDKQMTLQNSCHFYIFIWVFFFVLFCFTIDAETTNNVFPCQPLICIRLSMLFWENSYRGYRSRMHSKYWMIDTHRKRPTKINAIKN